MRSVVIAISFALAYGKPLLSSPLADYRKAAQTCSNKEFVQVADSWLILNPGYSDAITWMRKCSQYPESVLPVLRKLKEEVFRLENPPDIAGYLKEMKESRMKARMSRAWKLYLFLRSDNQSYIPEERQKIAAIPMRLESIALGRVEEPHRALCNVELDEENIVVTSRRESVFWRKFHAIKSRSDLPAADRSTLLSIEACLARGYADPSIGRGVHGMIGYGAIYFSESDKDGIYDSRSLSAYEGLCRRVVHRTVEMLPRSAQNPGPPGKDVLADAKEMRAGCEDELFRRSREEWEASPLREGFSQ